MFQRGTAVSCIEMMTVFPAMRVPPRKTYETYETNASEQDIITSLYKYRDYDLVRRF